MRTVFSQQHRLRNSQVELFGGELVSPFECPERMDYILAELKARGLTDIVPPESHGMAPVLAVHDQAYLDFMPMAWQRWVAAGFKGEAIPTAWPARTMRGDIIPAHIEAQLAYYCLASETSISEGTWEAALAAKDVALSAADVVLGGAPAAFALCRPPGHHASKDQYGGYCFLNNAAIAAQHARNGGAERVAVLDVDFHHGNGTQHIFYERDDVLMISLHGDPDEAFPYFSGYADEKGRGAGAGYTVNYPLPEFTSYDAWAQALDDALGKIERLKCDFLVVSLGVDTFEKDPISFFKLKSPDFTDYGGRIAKLGLPTLFVMEGGYAVEEIGVNSVNVLAGYLDASA